MLLPATPHDRPFLELMLTEAAYPPGTPRPTDPRADDGVARYLDGWGRPGDLGLVAWRDGSPLGAAWTRLLPPSRPGYGFVAPDVPELTVAVAAPWRGRGLGRALVAGALDHAAAHGTARVSLSVADATNPTAAGLYRSLGFTEVARDPGGSLTMVATTHPDGPDGEPGPDATPVVTTPPPSASDHPHPARRPDGTSTSPGGPMPPRGAPGEPSTRPAGPVPPPGAVRMARLDDGPTLARLREVMLAAEGRGGQPGWVAPFLRRWAEGVTTGRLMATVAEDRRGRPVTSAIVELTAVLPGPGQEHGRMAYISSVATEPAWRGRGRATACLEILLDRIDGMGIDRSRLAAAPGAEGLYARLGFVPTRHRSMQRTRPV